MSSHKSILMLLTVILIVACLCVFPLLAQQEDKKSDPYAAKITGTLHRMAESSKRLVALRKIRYEAGQIDFQLLVAAQRELMELELRLADTHKKRLGILDQQLTFAKKSEKVASVKLESGRGTRDDLLQTQIAAMRIEVRIFEEMQKR